MSPIASTIRLSLTMCLSVMEICIYSDIDGWIICLLPSRKKHPKSVRVEHKCVLGVFFPALN